MFRCVDIYINDFPIQQGMTEFYLLGNVVIKLNLTQKTIAELFEKGRSTITEHLKKIFKDAELDEDSVCRDFRHTAKTTLTIDHLSLTIKI
jgi:hypothetical protein